MAIEARQEGHPRRCTFAFKPGLVWVEQLGSDREDMGAASSREAFALDFGMDVADDGFRADPVRSRRSGLRLLCLHGHGANNDITAMQVEHLMLRDVHGVSCDLLQATDETSPQSSVFIDFSDQPFYTWFNHWWFTTGKHGVGAKGGSLHKALQRVMAVWQKHGPYDGIYGFSQGGFMAAALCNRAVYHGLFGLAECPFRFAILGCSALAHVLRTVEVVNGDTLARMVLPVPASDAASLHIIGQTDWHRSASEDNARLFADSTSYVHGHGHEMPMKLMNDFHLKRMLSQFFARFSATYQVKPSFEDVQSVMLNRMSVDSLHPC